MATPQVAREMAAAPVERTTRGTTTAAPTAKPVNPWRSIFTKAYFKALNPGEPRVFEKGTLAGFKQYRLAELSLAFSLPTDIESHFCGAFVVARVAPSGAKQFMIQWPVYGGGFRKIMSVNDDDRAAASLEDFGAELITEWKALQRERKANGRNVTPMTAGAITMGDDEAEELGIKLN